MFNLKNDIDKICVDAKKEPFDQLLDKVIRIKENHGFTRRQAALKAQEHGISKSTFFRFINRNGSKNPFDDLKCLWAFVAVYNIPEIESAKLVRALLCEFMNRGLHGISE